MTKRQLLNDIKRLGIRSGDTLLLRCSLRAISKEISNIDIVNAFIEVLTIDGTLVVLTFTKKYPIIFNRKKNAFKSTSPANTGGLANIVLSLPGAVRSEHPMYSFAAIGKNAQAIINGHYPTSPPFYPIGKLIELNGKMLISGCVEDSPGFTTVHYAQEKIGLSTQSWLSGLFGSYYADGDRIKYQKLKYYGGCSMGFSKFYKLYEKKNLLTIGKIGNAISYLINAREAFQVEYSVINIDPRFPLCNNPKCLSCRVLLRYNKRDITKYLYHRLRSIFFNDSRN